MALDTTQEFNSKSAPGWWRLDNAAKIYPAIRTSRWSSVYRVSLELKEDIDPEILYKALRQTLQRMPTFAVRMRAGVFWYYFEPNKKPPLLYQDVQYPCAHIDAAKNNGYLFKVRYYRSRIALEVFHSLADGTGGMVFLKTLTAQYLRLRYNIKIPCTDGVLDINESAEAEETEDAYKRYVNLGKTRSRVESRAYQVKGAKEPEGVLHVITGRLPAEALIRQAKQYGATVTEYLTAVYMYAVYQQQCELPRKRYAPVKISVPVNMRRFFPSQTVRNFSLFVNPEIDPNAGSYTFEEIVQQVHNFLQLEVNAKALNAQMAANVRSEKNLFVRVLPLCIKRAALSAYYHFAGETRFSGTLSNMGVIRLPEAMAPYVERASFILGRSKVNSNACAVATLGNSVYITFSRSIEEAQIERSFFTFLIRSGVPVCIRSNGQEQADEFESKD